MQRHGVRLAFSRPFIRTLGSILRWLPARHRTAVRFGPLQVGPALQRVLLIDHPLADVRAFRTGAHFLGQFACAASSTCEVSDDSALQQGNDLDVTERNAVRRPADGERIVLAERIRTIIRPRPLPSDFDTAHVILADGWQALDEELSNGLQAEDTQYPGADLYPECSTRSPAGNGANTAEQCPHTRTHRTSRQGAGSDDHCHLRDDIDQVIKDD